MSEDEELHSLSGVLNKLIDGTDGGGQVSVRDLLAALDTRSYGPLLLMPAAIAVSPAGAIPGVAVVAGSLIVLIAVQGLFGMNHPWLPGKLLRFSFSRAKLKTAIDRMQPWIKWLERGVNRRVVILTTEPFFRATAAACVLLALLFYPLALVPFGVAVPGLAIILLSLGLMARDGYLMVGGAVVAGGSGVLTYFLWPF